MSMLLIYSGNIFTQIFTTDEDMSSLPVMKVDLGINVQTNTCHCNNVVKSYGSVNTAPFAAPGYTYAFQEVGMIFNSVVAAKYNMKTLAQYDSTVENAVLPVIRVAYAPSLENFAMAIYEMMSTALANKMNATLSYVQVYCPMGSVKYPANSGN